MDLNDQRIVLTGAAGGIGRLLSMALVRKGARLSRLVRRPEADPLGATLGDRVLTLACDITQGDQQERAIDRIKREWGGIDVLINLAGVLDFQGAHHQDPDQLHRIVATNIEAPLQLTRRVLPDMLAQQHGRIVNVGSMFGSIGFPFFAAYSASKFALRGYSQALRRELHDTGVGVTYVSPRAINTPLNPPAVQEMARQGLMNMDEADPIAQAILRAIERDRDEVYLGFPESLFARINGLFPKIVDRALRKQTPRLRGYTGDRQTS